MCFLLLEVFDDIHGYMDIVGGRQFLPIYTAG